MITPPKTTSPFGLHFLEEEEGKVYKAYADPASGGPPWTIGIGHTGPEVHPGLVWGDAEIDRALAHDLILNEASINFCVNVPINQNQFDALNSFVHNEGTNALPHGGPNGGPSHLLSFLNAGDYQGAANQFLMWHIANGIPHFLDGRRMRERALFLTPMVIKA